MKATTLHTSKFRDRPIILWDIDGTLIQLSHERSDKHLQSVQFVTGLEFSPAKRSGGETDFQIVSDLLGQKYVSPNKELIQLAITKLNELTTLDLTVNKPNVSIGANEIIELSSELGFRNSLLTGNTAQRAKCKLENASLWQYFLDSHNFFGDLDFCRSELVARAVKEIYKVNDCQIIVVGDTPRDIQCAQQYGLPIIAVATGNHTLSQLARYMPSLTVKNFEQGLNATTNFLKHIISTQLIQ